jgi:hypothetical protein
MYRVSEAAPIRNKHRHSPRNSPELSAAERNALMSFAADLWWKSRRRRVWFDWNGWRFMVRGTSFRLLVTWRGQPVVCRYH